jgi:hypothetical protein
MADAPPEELQGHIGDQGFETPPTDQPYGHATANEPSAKAEASKQRGKDAGAHRMRNHDLAKLMEEHGYPADDLMKVAQLLFKDQAGRIEYDGILKRHDELRDELLVQMGRYEERHDDLDTSRGIHDEQVKEFRNERETYRKTLDCEYEKRLAKSTETTKNEMTARYAGDIKEREEAKKSIRRLETEVNRLQEKDERRMKKDRNKRDLKRAKPS